MFQGVKNGGVGKRLTPAVLKTVRPERVSWVRIPPPPPDFKLPLRSQCRRGNLNIRANSGGIHNTRLLSLQRQSAKSLD